MRIVSSTLAAAVTLSFVTTAGDASGARPWRAARRASLPNVGTLPQTRTAAQRGRYAASCGGTSHGSYAFDSTTLFKTNFTDTEQFGESNLAAAESSATFEGSGNTVCDSFSTIASGVDNVIDSGTGDTPEGAEDSFIGGGGYNTINFGFSFDGAGQDNAVSNFYSFAGAGYGNNVSGRGSFAGAGGTLVEEMVGNQVSGSDSFVGAGDSNSVAADEAFIGSGYANKVGATGTDGTILGGTRNNVSGEYASILGGFGNVATGAYAIVAGGDGDTAGGTLSFAAGYHADAAHNGSFVWSDYTSGTAALKDTAVNQFLVRASGGTSIYSNEAATAGVHLAAGSGTWSSLSDRNAKTDIEPLDDGSVLAKVRALPLSTWRYKSERGVRHTGPMAQDFYAAFGVGEDDRHITALDENGVALAAIKALSRQMGTLRNQVGNLHGQIGALHTENAALKARVAALERP